MKKLFAVLLILALILPVAAPAESYTPVLGMNMQEFLNKYNAVSAPLGSPYRKLENPIQWTKYDEYNAAMFMPTNTIIMLLMTKQKNIATTTVSGLDCVAIMSTNNDDMVDLISVTLRVLELFTDNLFGVSVGSFRLSQVIRYYYENNCKTDTGYAYWELDEEKTKVLGLSKAGEGYMFVIGSLEDMR